MIRAAILDDAESIAPVPNNRTMKISIVALLGLLGALATDQAAHIVITHLDEDGFGNDNVAGHWLVGCRLALLEHLAPRTSLRWSVVVQCPMGFVNRKPASQNSDHATEIR